MLLLIEEIPLCEHLARGSFQGRPLGSRGRRAMRVRRAFERQAREHAIPISGVVVLGWPPRWTWVQPSDSGRPTNFLLNASTWNDTRASHPSQIAISSYVMLLPLPWPFKTPPAPPVGGSYSLGETGSL